MAVAAGPPDGADASPASRWLERVPDVRAVFAVLGLLFYAVLRIATSVFYGRFGLSPDDLGLGYVELLVQSVVGTSIVLVVALAAAFLVICEYVGVVAFFNDIFRRQGTDERDAWSDLSSIVFTVVAVSGTGSAITAAVGLQGVSGAMLTLAIAVVLVWTTLRGVRVLSRGVLGAHRRRWLVLVAAVVLATVGFSIAALIGQARDDADRVFAGHPAAPAVFGVRMTSWGAETATLSWTSDQVAPDLRRLTGRCLMYLGQSGGTSFFYDPGAHETVRIPAAISAVRIRPPSCTH
jgi:hypothetical protein